MKLKPYPAYKDSGVEWLADVPADWNVVSIKWISPVQRGASPRPIDDQKYFDEDGEYAWVRIADVSSSDGVLRETTQRLSKLGSSLSVKIYPNELFVSIAGTVGKPCISSIKACIHDGFVYFPKLNIPAIFLYRIFEAGTCYGGLGKFGTQLNLNTDTIGSIRIALPPKGEINNIIEFLDRETGKLDTLISKQEKLIELLQEKRQAVISHAVTKGLDPDTPMKDSGVEWLGEVPENWVVSLLKRGYSVNLGKMLQPESKAESDELLPYLRAANIQWDAVDVTDVKEMWISKAEKNYLRLEYGDLLVSEGGDVGRSSIWKNELPECYYQNSANRVRSLNGNSNRFLYYWILAVKHGGYIDILCNKSTIAHFTAEKVNALPVAYPEPTEQAMIAEFLDKETNKIDTLIEKAKRSIELAKEHRTALISAAVTGKIDVREYSC